jgi:hypothetical protein
MFSLIIQSIPYLPRLVVEFNDRLAHNVETVAIWDSIVHFRYIKTYKL